MSPGTNSSNGISRRRVTGVLAGSNSSPARSTDVLVRTRALSARAALFERNSCTKRSPVLNTTITPMTTIASLSPVRPETTASDRQQEVERVGERARQLGVPRRRLLVRDVVSPVAQAARANLVVGQPVAVGFERRESRVRVTVRELGEASVGLRAVSSAAVLGLCGRGAGRGALNARGHVDSRDYGGLGCADVRNRSVPDSGQSRIFMAQVNGRER